MKNVLIYSFLFLIVLFSSCGKDDELTNTEDLPSTAEWTFKDGYSSNGTTYIKNQEIEEGTSHVDIRVSVTKAGTYNITTETINGYKFSGSGDLVVKEEGSYQAVTLWASGTPENSGEYEFEVNAGGATATFKTNVIPMDPAELDSKLVIRGTYDNWNDYGKLTAYNASTGEAAWSERVSGWISQAAVNADTVFYNGSEYLEARNLETGELIWSVTHTGSDGWEDTYNGITYYDGALYCTTDDGQVLSFSSADGSFLEEFDLETISVVGSVPALADGVMYVGHEYLWAFNTDGTFKWKYTLPGHSRSGATVDNGVVYINTDDGELCAINTADGTLKWQYTTGTDGEECPTVANGNIYSGNQNLYCLDASTGQLIWQKDDVVFEWDSPNIFNNILYVGGKGILHSLNAETGETIWEKSGTLSISSEVAACEEFVVSNSAGLVARYAENGEIIWSNVNYQSNDEITLNPFIYDIETQESYLTSSYGNKK